MCLLISIRLKKLNDRISNIVAGGSEAIPELTDARTGMDNVVYPILADRLAADYNSLHEEQVSSVKETNIRVRSTRF